MNNIVLIGFMGSGKSTVGPLLAQRLNRPFREIDDEVAADAGRSVSQIFASEGEPGFRRREAACLARALAADGQVIAVGGGAPLSTDNWQRIRDGNSVVALTAGPSEILRRLNGTTGRPLLGSDARTAVATLLPQRIGRYLEADLVAATDGRPAEMVADELADRIPSSGLERIAVDVLGAQHEAVVGRNLGDLPGPALLRSGAKGTVVIVTDPAVAKAHAGPIVEGLARAGFTVQVHLLPAGESAKSIDAFSALLEGLGELRLDRSGALVALGGGTVGDVTGFAAATWLRGIRYLQLPTTLLAMVDSSIGGKTAINLRSGKNLVGAVHQPVAIICDLEYLETLPDAEFRSGMAEVCKAGMIADKAFVGWLRQSSGRIRERDVDALREMVSRAVAIKASVVRDDPRETGPRAILNYGHTVGHGLERVLGYGTIRHGEAVAWGMEVAAELSLSTDRCSPEVVRTQRALLQTFGLLEQRPRVPHSELLDAMAHDKKSNAGEIGWVLLQAIGQPEWGCRVDRVHVIAALDKVLPA
ncbi:MAG TPA: 3-dehydroquinate synthase [Candidatus Dormibacteraeota bacterium]